MDCVIPGHSVRQFCASIVCLSKIGRDIYLEFDPVEGLALRALNDAKSAYACFRFDASFFERCTAAPGGSGGGGSGRNNNNNRRRNLTEASQTQDEPKFSARVPVRALSPVVRPRKDVVSLQLRSETSSAALMVEFDFQIHQKNHDTLLRVVHRVKAADADAVSAVAKKEESSEIVTSPKVLMRLLEPLKKTMECALCIRKDSDIVTAASFHHTDTKPQSKNEVLQATSATLLKTETCIGIGEFEEFFFRDERSAKEEDEDDDDDDDNVPDMPDDVNECIILVFPIKECKAMLQFCSQASQLDHERQVSVFFHWGGRPLLFETNGEGSSAKLVLATLDYKLLAPMVQQQSTTPETAGGNNNQQ